MRMMLRFESPLGDESHYYAWKEEYPDISDHFALFKTVLYNKDGKYGTSHHAACLQMLLEASEKYGQRYSLYLLNYLIKAGCILIEDQGPSLRRVYGKKRVTARMLARELEVKKDIAFDKVYRYILKHGKPDKEGSMTQSQFRQLYNDISDKNPPVTKAKPIFALPTFVGKGNPPVIYQNGEIIDASKKVAIVSNEEIDRAIKGDVDPALKDKILISGTEIVTDANDPRTEHVTELTHEDVFGVKRCDQLSQDENEKEEIEDPPLFEELPEKPRPTVPHTRNPLYAVLIPAAIATIAGLTYGAWRLFAKR